ncbi:MAG: hypothetical protein QM477_01995 [Planctomycetota bacterium]
MKRFLLPLASVVVLGACAGPEIHEADVIRINGQDFDYGDEEVRNVVVEVRNFADDLDLDFGSVDGRLSDGRLAVQFRITNQEDEAVRLRCSWTWRDADGIVLRRGAYETPEKLLVLRPGEERTLPFTSPTESAIQFVVRVEKTDPNE